ARTLPDRLRAVPGVRVRHGDRSHRDAPVRDPAPAPPVRGRPARAGAGRMRLPLSWLAEFIDLPDDRALADRLAMDGGFEDVIVEATGPDLSSIVVGHVLSREQHPNADRLSVCRVDVGDGAPRAIVCGAPNVAAGQKVAVALPGTELPGGAKIKKSKLRGVESQGMICSRRGGAAGRGGGGRVGVCAPRAGGGA